MPATKQMINTRILSAVIATDECEPFFRPPFLHIHPKPARIGLCKVPGFCSNCATFVYLYQRGSMKTNPTDFCVNVRMRVSTLPTIITYKTKCGCLCAKTHTYLTTICVVLLV